MLLVKELWAGFGFMDSPHYVAYSGGLLDLFTVRRDPESLKNIRTLFLLILQAVLYFTMCNCAGTKF